jgi:hypothetical protein
MQASEPVGQYSLRSFVSEQLAQFNALEGAETVLGQVDLIVLQALQKALVAQSSSE